VLVLIEAMRDSSIFDQEAAGNMLEVVKEDPDFWLANVSGLWLRCHALQPWQALFLPLSPSLPPKPSCLGHLKPPQGSREGWEGQPRQWLHSSGSTILSCVSSRCQRS